MSHQHDGNPAWRQVVGAFYSIVAVICHIAVGAVILVAIWAMQELIHLLWGDKEPMIFGKLPLHYVVETSEAGVLVAFVFWGTISAFKAFRE